MVRYAQLVVGPAGSGKVRLPCSFCNLRSILRSANLSIFPNFPLVSPSLPCSFGSTCMVPRYTTLYMALDGMMTTWHGPPLQSTYCSTMQQHCESINRSLHIVNLDPAAERFEYSVAIGESQVYGLLAVDCHFSVFPLNFKRLLNMRVVRSALFCISTIPCLIKQTRLPLLLVSWLVDCLPPQPACLPACPFACLPACVHA